MKARPNFVRLQVDGHPVDVPSGASVAAAVAQVAAAFGRGPGGRTRAPICGMGVCFECRVSIDGADQQRACMTIARDGMQVWTAEARHG